MGGREGVGVVEGVASHFTHVSVVELVVETACSLVDTQWREQPTDYIAFTFQWLSRTLFEF